MAKSIYYYRPSERFVYPWSYQICAGYGDCVKRSFLRLNINVGGFVKSMLKRARAAQDDFAVVPVLTPQSETRLEKILINGCFSEVFHPTRGIRQGDLLSPYLFFLVVEGLLATIRVKESKSESLGLSICRNALVISYLLFADDNIILFPINAHSSTSIRDILQTYNELLAREVPQQQNTTSTPTLPGQYRLNVDAALDSQRQSTGLGAIVTDWNRNTIAGQGQGPIGRADQLEPMHMKGDHEMGRVHATIIEMIKGAEGQNVICPIPFLQCRDGALVKWHPLERAVSDLVDVPSDEVILGIPTNF
uniref:Reverse transcriptase domain-containing protein n=1 Tax=Cannabis sativa TaxID=3483 RepID=A0A803QIG6_CANSA